MFGFESRRDLKRLLDKKEERIKHLEAKVDAYAKASVLNPPLEPCISERCIECENAKIQRIPSSFYGFPEKVLLGCAKNHVCQDFKPKER